MWMLERKVTNIIVGRRDKTKRSQLRMPIIKNNQNVFVFEHQNVEKLLNEARKLSPLSTVFYLSTVRIKSSFLSKKKKMILF